MKKMKKALCCLFAAILCIGAFSGCSTETGTTTGNASGESTAEKGDTAPVSGGAAMNLTICGGSIGGAWASIGEGTGEVIRRSFPGSNVAYEVGQEAANVALVSSGKVDLGIAHTGLLKLAGDGAAPFNKEMDNLRAITVLYGEAAQQFIIKNDLGFQTLEDIKNAQYGLKINFNTKDSFMELVGKACLEAAGITYDDLASWGGAVDFISMGSSLDLMRDGKIEAYSNVIQVPSSNVVDAATSVDLTLLNLSDDVIQKVNDQLGTYKVTIPAGAYSFLKNDVNTVAATVVLFASADMPDETAYNIVKAIDENMEYFKGIHSSLSTLDLAAMQEVSPVELHPGAVKYYEEHK
ncbi:TAXI family TRAP transporter solute-binding subunit [Cuneatibacter sp. NSJ-177]|uniref:TAXI family TRAP transporter solute-binding subunit n=1 Tax=Cuneatibacter sp. NSJ-177 TaxID=2931401 RepID=UPI001FD3156C|nr:TAXI family TRAP transporter solute-binding subunit [Cuneatibacter sp. NSJ-177]MCJ7837529.1 TAXI family TRAP transporter solute-binding subunit [Cuneatibacter sp. NSJ-177]